MIVVNFFGGPGCGKSTLALDVSAELKRGPYETEYCHEWIKWELWAKNNEIINDQLTITAQAHRLQWSLKGQVEICVCDSPFLMSSIYSKIYPNGFMQRSKHFDGLVRELFDMYDNMNFFVERKWPYSQAGRYQNEREAKELDTKIYAQLVDNEIPFEVVQSTDEAVEHIAYKVEQKAEVLRKLAEMEENVRSLR